jgi:hypothetical protein
VAAVCLGACANHDHGAGIAATIPPASTPTFTVALNMSAGIVAGTQAGYGVRSLGPNTLRFVWTGDGSTGGGYHEFWGTIWTTGTFSNQVMGCSDAVCPLEDGDFVSAPYDTTGGQRIDWDTFASDGLDGFEVDASALPVFVDAYIDGVHHPELVFFADATADGTPTAVSAIPCAFTTQ